MEPIRGDSGYDADVDDDPEQLSDKSKVLRRKLAVAASSKYNVTFSYSFQVSSVSHSLIYIDIETSDKEDYLRPQRPSKKKGKKRKKSVKWQDISD
ncbi:hypothetical protein C0J52_17188 [Blattella germanica]|nr:hypothetical protein C0J52_17188 [Blattella germanica]